MSRRQRAIDVVAAASRGGFTITLMPVCEQLRVRGPKPGLSPELRAELVGLRAEVIELFRTHGCTGCGRFAFARADVLCYWCRTGRASLASGQRPVDGRARVRLPGHNERPSRRDG